MELRRVWLLLSLSILIVLGLGLASVTRIGIRPLAMVELSNSSTIAIEPGREWRFTYLWINSRAMSIDDVRELLEKINASSIAIRAVTGILEENVLGELVYRNLWVTVARGEPSDTVIGINISFVEPVNSVIELRIAKPSTEIETKTIASTARYTVIYVPLTHSGAYVFMLANHGTSLARLRVMMVRGYVYLDKPYLLPGFTILAISVPLLIYAIRRL